MIVFPSLKRYTQEYILMLYVTLKKKFQYDLLFNISKYFFLSIIFNSFTSNLDETHSMYFCMKRTNLVKKRRSVREGSLK